MKKEKIVKKQGLIENLAEIGLWISAFFIPIYEGMIYLGMFLALIGLVYKIIKRKVSRFTKTPLDLPLLIFILIGFISASNSLVPRESLIAIPVFTVGIFLSYYLVVNNISSEKSLKRFILAMILGGTAVSCFGISQHLIQGEIRSYATLLNPNVLGSSLVLIIPIVFSLLLYTSKKAKKVGLAVSFVVMVICLTFTYSRASWLALVGLMIFFLMIKKRKRFIIGLVLAVISAILIFTPSTNRRLSLVFNFGFSIKERIYGWESALQMIHDHPLTGIGINTFEHVYPQYQLPQAKESLVHAHNIFLEIGAEMGLPGLIALLWLFIRAFTMGWRALKKTKNVYLQSLLTGLLGSLVAFVINEQFSYSWIIHNFFIFFWMLLGSLSVVSKMALRREDV